LHLTFTIICCLTKGMVPRTQGFSEYPTQEGSGLGWVDPCPTLQPAGRASLYGLKATIGSVDVRGTSPYSDFTDDLGALTKSSDDLVDLMGILLKTDFTPFMTKSWNGQKVAFVNSDAWELPSAICDRDETLLKEQVGCSYADT